MNTHVCDTGHFDRTICPEPCGMMHSFCATCGKRADACAHDAPVTPDPTPGEVGLSDDDVLAVMRLLAPVVEHRRHYGLKIEDAEVYARTVLASDWLKDHVAARTAALQAEVEGLRREAENERLRKDIYRLSTEAAEAEVAELRAKVERRVSRGEVERALRAADVPEDEMATDEDSLRYTGRSEAVEIIRDMLDLRAALGGGSDGA